MALFPRFTRQEQRQTGVINPAAGADMESLANELEAFSARNAQRLEERTAEDAYQAGLEAEPGTAPDGSRGTIAGQAFNRGVIVSHQAALQTDIRDSIGRFAIEHPNDPDAFDGQVAGLEEGLLAEADPQLRPFIRDRLADYAGRAKLSIIETQQRELRAEAAANLERGAEGFLDDARTAGFEGDVPMVEARRQELEQLLEEGVAGGLLPEGEAADLRDTFEREVTGQEILGNFARHLEGNPDDAGAGAVTSWQKADPRELGLTVDDHEAITRQMITLRNRHQSLLDDQAQATAAEARAEQKVRNSRVTDAISVLEDGFAPDPRLAEQVAEDLNWLGANGTPSDLVDAAELARRFDVANAVQSEVHRFKRMPDAMRDEQLIELERALRDGGATPEQLQLLDALKRTDTQVRQALESDPRGYVNREGLVADEPLDFESAEGLAGSIAARAQTSEVGAQLIGRPLPLLTSAEAKQIGDVYQAAEIEERVSLLGVITAGAGDDAEATLGQLEAEGHERMALLGGFVLQGQSQLARDIMRGEAVLASDPGIKPGRADYQVDVDDAIGSALADWPDQRQQYLDAAMAKYAELKARDGDLSDLYKPRLFTQALEQVLPTGRFNGRRVAVPPGVTERSFDDWTDSWDATTFEGIPGADGEAMLDLVRDRGRLVELGNGRYGVTLSSAGSGRERILVREDGSPVTLDYPTGQ